MNITRYLRWKLKSFLTVSDKQKASYTFWKRAFPLFKRLRLVELWLKHWEKLKLLPEPQALCVVGSLGLENFARLRYEFQLVKFVDQDEAKAFREIENQKKAEKVTVQKIYEDVQKDDVMTWENIRGPRPGEDSKAVQAEARQRLQEAKEAAS